MVKKSNKKISSKNNITININTNKPKKRTYKKRVSKKQLLTQQFNTLPMAKAIPIAHGHTLHVERKDYETINQINNLQKNNEILKNSLFEDKNNFDKQTEEIRKQIINDKLNLDTHLDLGIKSINDIYKQLENQKNNLITFEDENNFEDIDETIKKYKTPEKQRGYSSKYYKKKVGSLKAKKLKDVPKPEIISIIQEDLKNKGRPKGSKNKLKLPVEDLTNVSNNGLTQNSDPISERQARLDKRNALINEINNNKIETIEIQNMEDELDNYKKLNNAIDKHKKTLLENAFTNLKKNTYDDSYKDILQDAFTNFKIYSHHKKTKKGLKKLELKPSLNSVDDEFNNSNLNDFNDQT